MNDLAQKKYGRRIWILCVVLLALGAVALGGIISWQAANQPPKARLPLNGSYPEMPADELHHYLNLPIDYAAPGAGSYRGFYILSQNFNPKGPVVFILTDGQMELVSPGMNSAFFDEQLPGLSYVVIGHRGHSPAEFPEVFPNGKLDIARAMRFYGSWQRVEDIERVRRDMAARKLLPSDGQIMIFGASGAGVLAQQYLARYGDHVGRALLISTGASDLAHVHGWPYGRALSDIDPAAAQAFAKNVSSNQKAHPGLAYMMFQLGREGNGGISKARQLAQGGVVTYAWYAMHPNLNWPLARTILGLPAATAAKVRMYELLGSDLQKLVPQDQEVPLYVWSKELLGDFIRAAPALPQMNLDRSAYKGEVLVISGKDDVVFSPAIGQAIADAYPKGSFLLVRGGHRLELDRHYQQEVRKAFLRYGLKSTAAEVLLRTPSTTKAPH